MLVRARCCVRTCNRMSRAGVRARIARPMTHRGRVYVRMSLPAARAPTLATHPFYCMQLLFLEISACRPRLGVVAGRSGNFELLLLLFSSLVFSTCQVVHQVWAIGNRVCLGKVCPAMR